MSPQRHRIAPLLTGRARDLRRDSTFPERKLWSLLRGSQVAGLKFRRQTPIGRYIVDFYCASAKLAIELDGLSHVDSGERDDQRRAALEKLGVRIVRFTNDQVLQDSNLVAEAIAREAGVPW